jgi:hypothetical protein
MHVFINEYLLIKPKKKGIKPLILGGNKTSTKSISAAPLSQVMSQTATGQSRDY